MIFLNGNLLKNVFQAFQAAGDRSDPAEMKEIRNLRQKILKRQFNL